MMREIFRIHLFGFELPLWGYGLMLVIGFYVAMQVGRALARRSGIDPDAIVNVALIALVFGIIGARLSHVIENFDEYTNPSRSAWQNFLAMINIPSGGLTFYGGFILATIACITYARIAKIPLRLGMDIIAPCVMIGLGFGRIGCFLNGCCYGAECEAPWAVSFPYGSNAYIEEYDKGEIKPPAEVMTVTKEGFPRLMSTDEVKKDPVAKAAIAQKVPGVTSSKHLHPAQIYSAITAFFLACILIAFYTTQPAPGRVFAFMLMKMKQAGLDSVDVSVGFNTPTAKIPWGPDLLGDIAGRVLKETGLPGTTSWYINGPAGADKLVREGKIDYASLARPFLADPHWPYQAAKELGVENAAWKTLPAAYAHWLSRYRGAADARDRR